ncbi:MAG: serine hydrolase domain-containing protein [Chloroflexota bacterium]
MIETEIDQKLFQLVSGIQHPLSSVAVIVYSGGNRVYEAAFGEIHLSPPDNPRRKKVTLNTKFRIASISKWVMTLGLMLLVDQGLLDLDEDLNHYLDFSLRNRSAPQTPITIRHLLSHTSTIHDGNAYSIPLPFTLNAFFEPGAKFYEDGNHFVLNQTVGEYFNYSNLNYGIAATIMEKVTQTRFDRLMRQLVLGPLNLVASYNVSAFSADALRQLAPLYRFVQGAWVPQVDDYSESGPLPLGPVENPDRDRLPNNQSAKLPHQADLTTYQIGTNGTLFSPQGGLRISANGLATLMEMVFDRGMGKIGLSPARFQEMLEPYWEFEAKKPVGEHGTGLMRSYGLSTHRFLGAGSNGKGDQFWPDTSEDHIWYGHLGDAYGLLSGFLFEPKNKNGMIYIIGGTPADLSICPGRYSSFHGWEEDIFQAVFPLFNG